MEKTAEEIIRELDEQANSVRSAHPVIVNWPGAFVPDPDDPMKPAMDGLSIAIFNRLKKPATHPEGEE